MDGKVKRISSVGEHHMCKTVLEEGKERGGKREEGVVRKRKEMKGERGRKPC